MKFFALFLIMSVPAFSATAPIVKTINDQDLKWGPCPEIFPTGCEMTVIQGDPKTADSDIYLKVPAKYSIPAHSHTSAEHMNLISGELNLKYQGSEAQKIKPGSYIYGPAGVAHQATCVGPAPCVLAIEFDKPIDAKLYKGTL